MKLKNMTIFKLLRIQQWIKNILLFVPILSVGLFEKNLYFNLTKSFIFFSLFVSGTYILNDLTDIESDKLHPTKNKRPIASGQISTKKAYFLMSILFLTGFSYYFIFQFNQVLYLIFYLIGSIIYTKKLKYVKYVDILTISFLFLLRLYLGAGIINVNVSIYLGLLVLFFSISVVSSKKLSILGNNEIKNSKIKIFLTKSYSNKELKNYFDSSLICSSAVYLFWIIYEKDNTQTILIFYLSFIFLLMCLWNFLKLTRKEETEEIVNLIFKNRNLLLTVLLFGISFVSALFFQ
tara:strand:+ start:12859 stop:13734 length:876 start_codon:yes stop_codon:yes gene_type:complete